MLAIFIWTYPKPTQRFDGALLYNLYLGAKKFLEKNFA